MKDYLNAFKKIFNFRDEATLKEFWNFLIFNFIVNIILRFLSKRFLLPEYLHDTFTAIATLALVSVGFRRIKNAGYCGWLFLIPIVNLILALLPQKEGKLS